MAYFIGIQLLEGVQIYNVPQEKERRVKILCAACENRLQSRVCYYDDNAVLIMQCDAQSYFKL
jgi:hypothetical protein